MAKASNSVPQYVLFKFCRAAVGRASLARTLAECLYWLQHSTKQIDGQPTIWKTGTELAETLGIAPKTANEHLKRLASLGFWELRYKPRPYHPSPVSWLVFSQKAFAIVEAARDGLMSNAAAQGSINGAIEAEAQGAPIPPKSGVQSPQNGMLKQNSPATIPKLSSQENFIPAESFEPDGKNELPKKKLEAGKEKAPSYLKASTAVEALVNSIQEQLKLRNMPEWDTSSQYTWKHASALRDKLNAAGIGELHDQENFVSKVLDQWTKMHGLMAWRYKTHAGNSLRPTPLALAHEFASFKDAIYPPPLDPLVTHNGFNFSLF